MSIRIALLLVVSCDCVQRAFDKAKSWPHEDAFGLTVVHCTVLCSMPELYISSLDVPLPMMVLNSNIIVSVYLINVVLLYPNVIIYMPVLIYMSETKNQTWQSNVLKQDKCAHALFRWRHQVTHQPLVVD